MRRILRTPSTLFDDIVGGCDADKMLERLFYRPTTAEAHAIAHELVDGYVKAIEGGTNKGGYFEVTLTRAVEPSILNYVLPILEQRGWTAIYKCGRTYIVDRYFATPPYRGSRRRLR